MGENFGDITRMYLLFKSDEVKSQARTYRRAALIIVLLFQLYVYGKENCIIDEIDIVCNIRYPLLARNHPETSENDENIHGMTRLKHTHTHTRRDKHTHRHKYISTHDTYEEKEDNER